MFWGMIEGDVDCRGLEIEHDIQELPILNQKAAAGLHHVTAMSFHTYARLSHLYRPLKPGISWGHSYGPKIISQQDPGLDQRLAVPGLGSTAALLAKLYGWTGPMIELPYLELVDAVQAGQAEAALIIHEEQLLYQQRGFRQLVDLGQWWADHNHGLPVPLGVNCIRRDLDAEIGKRYSLVFRDSIAAGLAHREAALDFAMRYARSANRELAREFVGMYVNESTLDLSDEGRRSISLLFEGFASAVPLDFVD
jgi:1,4-dihydroxy-6-naphthoate synthase